MKSYNKSPQNQSYTYQELWKEYQMALETITYQQFRIQELNQEVDAWCYAYDEIIYDIESQK